MPNDIRTVFDIAANELVEIELTDKEQAALDAQRVAYKTAADAQEQQRITDEAAQVALKDKIARKIDTVASLLAAVKDPAVQQLLGIILDQLNLLNKASGIDHSADATISSDKLP